MKEEIIPDGGPAFPCLEAKNAPNEGMSLLGYFASKCDVSMYEPLKTFTNTYGKDPTLTELAEFISFLRFNEANEMVKLYLKTNEKAS